MNLSYAQFLELSENERSTVFTAAAERLDTREGYVEKDFWVCLTLDLLFNSLPEGLPKLLFKGGTSLSKVYGLIERFSEDIDVTVFRGDLVTPDNIDPMATGLSRKETKRRRKRLVKAASEYVQGELRQNLAAAIAEVSPDVRVEPFEGDQEESTLLVRYPGLFPGSPMDTEPQVTIESGARSALDPHSDCVVEPYVAQELAGWNLSVPNVTTIAAERTLWDKVFIIFGLRWDYENKEGKLPSKRNPSSRHYYDVAQIAGTKIGAQALADLRLMDDVRRHSEIMFEDRRLDEARPGSFRLVPVGGLRDALRADYNATTLNMMLGEGPAFDDVIDQIKHLEEKLNAP